MRGASVAQTKAHYKGPKTGEDFIVYISDYDEFLKWRGGLNKEKDADTSIPLVSFIDSFKIFKTDKHGSQGYQGAPSDQELDTEFGATKPEDVIPMILNAEIGDVQRDGAPLRIEVSKSKERGGDRNVTQGPTVAH